MDNIDKNYRKLEHINLWISNCDTKSSFVLAFLGVMVTIIFSSSLGKEMVDFFNLEFTKDINCVAIKNFICGSLVIFFFISIIITIYNIYYTLKGRRDVEIYKQPNLKTDSNIFCRTIAEKTFENFVSDSDNDDELIRDINSQIFINANIANKKFTHYNRSLLWLVITFSTFLIFVLIK